MSDKLARIFKIATWNVNSLKVRLPQVLEWLNRVKPDVLALQETKLLDANFPAAEINQAGYHVIYNGQRTYNGVATLVRETGSEIIDIVIDIPHLADPQRRVLGITWNDLRIVNLYVPNGESIVSEKYQYKLMWLQKLYAWMEEEIKRYPKLIIVGDFNIAPEDQDVYDPLAWRGSVLCSDKERMALQRLLSLGIIDCFRLHTQPPNSFSWWDYRMNAFKRNRGLRIDHIFAAKTMSADCIHCSIDPLPRASERPSDHAPVIAEFLA
ncbi:MAG: xthA [Gammaproteobacteria bacterium]|nr:xthA [Gammaproteobacteria bacterium]